MLLQIDHSTSYRYRAPVEFTPHLLRLTPKASPGLHLVRSSLQISPQAFVRWNLDAEENIVATATLVAKGEELLISSSVLIEQKVTNPFDFLLDERSLQLPISYTNRETSLLAPYLGVQGFRHAPLRSWLEPFIRDSIGDFPGSRPDTLALLIALNRSVPILFRYSQRHESGVQSPAETLDRGEGTCRDFALLMMESARSLGIAARYVSGYLCASPSVGDEGKAEAHTHGWFEVYLPGGGWRGFDPTNGILSSTHHVPVATAITAGEIPPVEGSYLGEAGECMRHDVRISATELQSQDGGHS